MKRLSIIIPSYNTGKYLRNLLHNLMHHQFDASYMVFLEIIVVNDGSTDNTETIATNLAAQYPDLIRLISTSNRGVSAARNEGLRHATGEFVCFFDADDLIVDHALYQITDYACKNVCDIVHFEYNTITTYEYETLCKSETVTPIKPYTFKSVNVKQFLTDTNGMAGPPIAWNIWQNIFRRNFLLKHNCRFEEGLIIGEDNLFMWKVLLQSPVMLWVKAPIYTYHERNSSIIHSDSPETIRRTTNARFQYLNHLYELERYIADRNYNSIIINGLRLEIRNVFYRALGDLMQLGGSLAQAVSAIQLYKQNGGDMRPGRPRFHRYQSMPRGLKVDVKRWLLSYPIGIFYKYFCK